MAEETTTDLPSQTSLDLPATPAPNAPEAEEVDPRVLASAPINVDEAAVELSASFDDWKLAPDLLRSLTDMGYERPMPVQEAVFTVLAAGKDLMVQSKTGSGKTAAFGIPIAQRLADGKKGVQSLILAPTRELAMQVAREIEKITVHMDVTVVPVYGGAPINPQIKQLEAGAQIVAGTPGRVLDHIRRKTLDTSGIRMLVLDECDEMLSMGFQEEIENIISTLPGNDTRQTLLFSATIPKEIERIGRRHMREPEMISLSSDSVGADLIDHYYYVVNGMARTRDLLKLMKSERPESALIFCNTREETSTVARYLTRHGYDAEHLSSDLSQADRERVMGRMKAKNLNFLVATDIAARGIDISELSHVINYTFPGSPEVYVHRSGRTGRAGSKGTALSLVGPREIGAFYYLKLIYKIIPTERDLPTSEEMATIEEGEQYQNVIKLVEGTPKSEFLGLAKRLWQSNEGERVVAMLLQELITKKPASAKAAPKAAKASPARAAVAPELEAATITEAVPTRDEGRKRRRRRRGAADEEQTAAAPAAPAPEESSIETSAVLDITSNTPQSAIETPVIEEPPPAPASEQSAEAEPATPPKRKRRRRRGAAEEQETQAQEDSADAVSTDAASETSTDAASEAESTDTASEDDSDPDTVEAVHVALADQETSEQRPQRKRRRRGAKSDKRTSSSDEDTASETADSEGAAPGDENAVVASPEGEEPKPRAKAKSRKRKSAKPATEPGPHAEFWEAWAETKDTDTDADDVKAETKKADSKKADSKKADSKKADSKKADSEKADSKQASSEDSEDEEEAAPKKKRRSRRRRRNKDEESEEEENEAEEAGDGVRVFVNVGRREDADADEIRDFLVEALGEAGSQLGKITLRNTHCYIRVPEEIVDSLIEACTGLVFHEREMVVERAKR